MKVIVVSDYEEMSRVAAETVADVIKNTQHPTLGLATGSTPIGMYRILAEYFRNKELSFADATSVNLDEYVGLGEKNDQSYVYFMAHNFFDNIDIKRCNTHLPDGLATDLAAECKRYTDFVKAHPQDIQILGIGSNGHIGFNEPFTPFDSHTHVVNLAESTIKDNSRLFDNIDDVPRQALTMGIGDIMQAKKILLLANGANKAKAIAALVNGEVTESVPATVLQRHPDCIVIVDEAAASLIEK